MRLPKISLSRFLVRVMVVVAVSAIATPDPATAAAAAPVPAADAAGTVDCLYCQARLQTLAELRKYLPPDWTATQENDPVFGGRVAVVQAGRTHAQTVLMIHGLGRNGMTDWLSTMPRLARDYHVIAVDLPGYGYSTSPTGRYSPTRYAQVVKAVLDRHAKGPAIVVGHSMGAAVALRLAADAPAQVAKVVLVNAAGILHRNTFVKAAAGGFLSALPLPEVTQDQAEQLKQLGGTVIEQLFALPIDPTEMLRQSEPAWGAVLVDRTNVNAALALVDEDFSAALDAVQAPVQIIWGAADPVAPLRTASVLAYRLPQAQVHVMPGVGHTPMQTAAERFNDLLSQVLRAQPVSAVRFAMAPSDRDLECVAAGTGSNAPVAPANSPLNVDRAVTGGTYGGHYHEVRIIGCHGIRLEALSAKRIVIRDAAVSLTDVIVQAGAAALEVTRADVMLTAATLQGETAVRADNSRVDLAGVRMQARGNAVEVAGRSRFIASVSTIRSPAFTGPWHETQELAEGVLQPRRSAP